MRLHANARLTPAGRLLLCRRVCDQGRTLRQAAEAAGVSERTARRWLARYRAEGQDGLVDRSSRPLRSPGGGASLAGDNRRQRSSAGHPPGHAPLALLA